MPDSVENPTGPYVIRGRYAGRTETVDEFESRREAEKMLAEYRMAFGVDWSLWIVGDDVDE